MVEGVFVVVVGSDIVYNNIVDKNKIDNLVDAIMLGDFLKIVPVSL